MRCLLAALVPLLGLLAADPAPATPPVPANPAVDRELVRYQQAVARLKQQRDEAVAKEKAKVIPVLAAAARAAVKRGDMAAATATWRQVLVLDRDQADAVGFFTSLGQLDRVLQELDGDPLAPTAAPGSAASAAAVRTIAARPGTEPDFTDVAAGTRFTFSYVEGTWTFRGDVDPESPDAARDERFRLAILVDGGERGSLRPVASIRTDTAREPLTWVAPRAFDKLWLGIHRQREPAGQVRYRVERMAPETAP
jgi:hypothetical protein